jgi:hypothetical protein
MDVGRTISDLFPPLLTPQLVNLHSSLNSVDFHVDTKTTEFGEYRCPKFYAVLHKSSDKVSSS